MSLQAQPGVVTNLSAEELREYIATSQESEYQLIDVREPEEYARGHIPGAQLIPLSEIEARQPQIRRLRDQNAIFYCRSGGRSFRAATWASQLVQLHHVFNLVGGWDGYRGQTAVTLPRLRSVDLSGGAESLLRQALALEKGTHEFYELLLREYVTGPIATAMHSLAEAEIAHAHLIHKLLGALADGPVPSFTEMFAAASGRIVEGGATFAELLDRVRSVEGAEAAVLELALEIELSAYDLYKSLAAVVTGETAKHALLDLAQQEKRHSQMVLRALAQLER